MKEENDGGNFMQRQIEALVATRRRRRKAREVRTEGRTARRSFSGCSRSLTLSLSLSLSLSLVLE